jgi:hypothetical protein
MMILFLLTLVFGCSSPIQSSDDILSDDDVVSGDDGSTTDDATTGTTGAVQVGIQSAAHNQSGFFRNMVRKGPPPGLTRDQCKEITDGGPVKGPGCVTDEIKCGQTIVGHTRGGVNKFSTQWYDDSTCWPATRSHKGGDERLYRFDPDANGIPARFWANIWFDTPCERDIDFTVFRTSDRSDCPTAPTPNCDMSSPFKPQDRTRRNQRVLIDPGEIWYVLIEGADDKEGPFSVTFNCELGE